MNNTFGKYRLPQIKKARTLLRKQIDGSGCNNRDTHMLEGAIKTIEKVIEYNQEKQ